MDSGFWTPRRFALLLALLVFAAFADVLLGVATFRYRDFGFYSYPVAFHLRESLLRGELPFWNELSNCGIPFLAQWSHLALYPPALFYVVFPIDWALGVFCVLHLYLAGLGMYFLAWRWTEHRLGAALAGVIFAFNGLTLNCLMWSHYMAVVGWTPWVILAAEDGWRRGGRSLALAVVIGSIHMLAGVPEFVFFTWLFIAALFLARFLLQRPRAPRERVRFALLVALIACVCAPQLLPFLDLLAASQRDAQFSTNIWSMPATGWANFLVPQFRCYLNKDGSISQYGQYFTSSYYCGVGAVLLALLALARPPPRALFLAGVAALALVFALGENGFLYPLARLLVPGVGVMRYPAKFVFFAVLCLPLLAAFGLRATLESARNRSSPGRAAIGLGAGAGALALGIVGIVGYAWAFPLGDENWPMTWQNGLARLGFLVLAVWLLQRLGAAGGRANPAALGAALLLTSAADVLTHFPRQSPTTARNSYQPDRTPLGMHPAPAAGVSRAMISRQADAFFKYLFTADPASDYALSRQGQFSNCNLLDAIPKVDGFFPLYVREQNRLMEWLYFSTNAPPEPLLDFLGVSRITRAGELFRWDRRDSAMPWISAGQAPRFADDSTAFAALTHPSFDPRSEVFLVETARASVTAEGGGAATILAATVAAHRIQVQVTNAAPALVVLSQTWYPRWKAWIDGAPARIWRANYAFMAIQAPAGPHRIELRYVDTPFRIGLGLCGLGLGLTALMATRGKRIGR